MANIFSTALEQAIDFAKDKTSDVARGARSLVSRNSNFQKKFNQGYQNFARQQQAEQAQKRQQASQFTNRVLNQVRSEAPRLADRVLQSSSPAYQSGRLALNLGRGAINKANKTIPGGIEGGINRVKTSIQSDPGQYSITRGFAKAPQDARLIGKVLGNEQLGEDIGYGVRGAANLTGINLANRLGLSGEKTKEISESNKATTDRQKRAEKLGQAIYGTVLTAPLGSGGTALGAVKAIGSRALQGTTLGLAMTTAGKVLGEGRLPTAQELAQGGIEGIENSWQLAFTNSLTDATLGKFAATAGLTDDAIDATFKAAGKAGLKSPEKLKLLSQGMKQLFFRSLAEVPAENSLWTFVDQLNGDAKENFIKEWVNNLPGNILGNVAFGVGSGGVRSAMKLNQADIGVGLEALKKTIGDQSGGINLKGAIDEVGKITSSDTPQKAPGELEVKTELPSKQAKEDIADQIEEQAIKGDVKTAEPIPEPEIDPLKIVQEDMARNLDEQKMEELVPTPKEEVIPPEQQMKDKVSQEIEQKVFAEEQKQLGLDDTQIKPKDGEPEDKSILQRLSDDFEKARELRQKKWDIPSLKGVIKTAWSDKYYYAQKHDPELYLNMRLFGGGGDSRTSAIIEKNIGPVMKQEADAGRAEDFANLLALDRLNELVDRGFKRNLNKEEIQKGFAELQAKYTPEELGQMRANAQKFRGFLTTLLDRAEQVGLVSKESADAARQSNELYVTLESIGQMNREFNKQGFFGNQQGRGGQTFNVSKQDVLKKIGDSESGIADPTESSLQYMVRTIDNVERNAILKDFVERRGAVQAGDGWIDPVNGAMPVAIPMRQAETVREKIKINSEIAELKPVQNKVERMLRNKSKKAQQLEKEINNLNLEGLGLALQNTKEAVEGSSYFVGTNQNVKSGKQAFVEVNVPPSTKKMVENLIELPSSDLKRIKRKIENRDSKLGGLMDEITKLSDDLAATKDDLIELRKERGELIDLKEPPEGYGTLTVFRDGIKEEWAIPKELEVAVKNLDTKQSGTVIEAYNKFINQPFKQLVTSKNPVFALLVNPIKDVQNALFAESSEKGFKEAGGLVQNYVQAIGDAFGLSKQRENWLLAGGGQSGFLSSEMKVDPTAALGELKKRGGFEINVKEAIKKPFDMLDYVSRSMEESTRLSKFNKDWKKLDPKLQEALADPYIPLANLPRELREVALASRNITQDFSRMGTMAQQVNKIIPFFNVALQGTLRLGSMAKNNPKRFVAAAAITNAIPALITFNNNKQYEDYQDLRDYERRGNMIWIYKDRTPEERENGEPLHAIKVPLGQWGAPFYNIAEELYRFTEDGEPGATDRLMSNLLTSGRESIVGMSPIGDASSLIPIPAKVSEQLKNNVDFYSGMPIEPNYIEVDGEKVKREELPSSLRKGYYTGPTTELLGRLTGPTLGLSPAQLDSIINTTTGGAGKTVLAASDTLLGSPPETKNNPLLKRFMAPRGGQLEQNDREAQDQENKQIQEELYGEGINFEGLSFGKQAQASDEFNAEPIDPATLPEETESLEIIYDDAQKVISGYEKKRVRIQYGDYKSETERKRDLAELDSEYEAATNKINTIEQERPEQVFEIEMSLHGENHPEYIKVGDRADWAYNQLSKVQSQEEFDSMVNQLWENGVLTGRSNGVAAYIKDVYGIDVSTYTGDDPATKKKVGSSSSGSGKKKSIPKLNISIPKAQIPALQLASVGGGGIGSGLSGLFETNPAQIGYQGISLKVPQSNDIRLPAKFKPGDIAPMRTRMPGL